ncbi:MAG TPA: YkgJ family cysteine cluster protein [Polyangiaceae bacterium]|nr:YkgJ family cysteine cluster protein [Polyangiaceae bacterium]
MGGLGTGELLQALPSSDRKDCESVIEAARQAANWKPPAKVPARMARAAIQKTELLVGKRLKTLGRQPALACAKGCASCCYGTKVDISAPEALLLAEFLKETLGAAELAGLVDGVKQEASRIRDFSLESRALDRAPCVLLESTTQSCRVHAVRPMACRAHHSLEVEPCVRAFEDPGGEHFALMDPEILRSFELGAFALEHALRAKGLDGESYELTQALLIALSEPDAAQRWLKGQPIFEAARVPSDEADREWVEQERGRAPLTTAR